MAIRIVGVDLPQNKRGEIALTYVSVSYTHLDVYKRQVALPRIRDFKGIESKFDGKGNYTLGIQEQIIFPEINIDSITRILGMRCV